MSKSGLTGVHYDERCGTWRFSVSMSAGSFETAEQAADAREFAMEFVSVRMMALRARCRLLPGAVGGGAGGDRRSEAARAGRTDRVAA